MAFATDLSLSLDNVSRVTTNPRTFTIIGQPLGGSNKSIRIDTVSTSVEPVTLEISHRDEGGGAQARAVRSATYRKKKLNAEGVLVEGSVTFTFRCPKDTAINPNNDLRYGYNAMINLLSDTGMLDKLLRGEV